MDVQAIQKRIKQLDGVAQEVKAAKEMLKSELESEPTYLEAFEEAKAAAAKKKKIVDEITGRGPNQKLVLEIKENMEEISTLRQILSAELMEVYQENKIDEIPDYTGATRKFKVNVVLEPKKGGYQDRDTAGRYQPEGSAA